MGPMNEITCAFDHLSTELTLLGLRVNVKMQTLEFIKDFFKHNDSLGLHFGHIWLMHFGCASGFSDLCHTFFGWGFTSKHGTHWWFSFPRKRPCFFGHFVFICSSSTFLSHTNNTSFSFFLSLLALFDRKVMHVCGDIIGPRPWESL
jgi:hypothetical protein